MKSCLRWSTTDCLQFSPWLIPTAKLERIHHAHLSHNRQWLAYLSHEYTHTHIHIHQNTQTSKADESSHVVDIAGDSQ